MKDHEKFIAFCLLGAALVGITIMAYVNPLNDANTNSIQIINTIVGALTLAFGGAANALFRIRDNESVEITNRPNNPVPVEETPER